MSLTGTGGRPALPGRHLGLRRDGRAARADRGAGRAARTGRETGRGQHVEVNLLSSALSGLVNHSSAVVAAGATPTRMGNSHPSLFPYDALPTADGEMIITAGNDGQFRKLCEVLGVPELVDDPRFRRNQDRTANREELRPLLVERLRTRTADEWFRELIAAGVPCGPINTVNDGVAFADELGLDPVVRRAGGVPSIRNPITFSGHPGRLPAAAARAGRARRRDPGLAGGRRGDQLSHLAGHVRRRPHPAARPRPRRRPDGQGRLRRAGVLAAGRPAARRPARCGSSRRCWSRWPTTASPRPRSPPG